MTLVEKMKAARDRLGYEGEEDVPENQGFADALDESEFDLKNRR